jgi:hypothetical protein
MHAITPRPDPVSTTGTGDEQPCNSLSKPGGALMERRPLWHAPLLMSMTSIIMSMIWTPVMMVRSREAWPGQSTSVNCSCGLPRWASWGGVGTYGGVDAENTGSAL